VKKKLIIHFDAVVVIILLFATSLGLNVFLCSQYSELSTENEKLQWHALADSFNLDSQATYIQKLEKLLKQTKID
jgi:hypothetical protein